MHQHRRPALSSRVWLGLTVMGGLVSAAPGTAADLSPAAVADFTRKVQPLVLNKCAAGACHGGPAAHEPRFRRADVRGSFSRADTLANIDVFLQTLGPDRDPKPLIDLLSVRHPAGPGSKPTSRTLTMSPLTPRERMTIESWIRGNGIGPINADPETHLAHAVPPTNQRPSKPNRFQAMLDAAANPAPLPPPQEPQGVIFGKDQPTD
jgi:hypothetical protein